MKTILTTEPHGEQSVVFFDEQSNIGNSLFSIHQKGGPSMVMTGEELTSLAKQWIKYSALVTLQSSKRWK